MSSSEAVVKIDRLEGNVAVVTLNRPAQRNTINGELTLALGAAVKTVESDPTVRAVILTGAGSDFFCAGADLTVLAAGNSASIFTVDGNLAGFVRADKAKPWIAALNGRAIGGGCEIALACDMIVAVEGSSFMMPEVMRGLAPTSGGAFRLPRALPLPIAVEVLTTGLPLSAERAFALGLVNRLVAPDKVLEEALMLARRIARNSPTGVRAALKIARDAHNRSTAELWDMSARERIHIYNCPDAKEGPKAFLEKRAPNWAD
jgi:enoyl-CoA hydratase/carnithine racemase